MPSKTNKAKLTDQQIEFCNKYYKQYGVNPYLSGYQYINNHCHNLELNYTDAFNLCRDYLRCRRINLELEDFKMLLSLFRFICKEKGSKTFYKNKFMEYLDLMSGDKYDYFNNLKLYTQYIKNGKIQEGVESIDDLSFARLKIAYAKIKQDYEEATR